MAQKTNSPYARIGRILVQEKQISAIPIKPRTKVPGIYDGKTWHGMKKWSQYSERFPTEEEISLWETWPQAGVCVLLGKLSGIIAVDYDEYQNWWAPIERQAPEPLAIKRGEKGLTAFYSYDGQKNAKVVAPDNETVVDFLSDGRQTVIPDTIHPCGEPYEWLSDEDLSTISLDDKKGSPFPDFETFVGEPLSVHGCLSSTRSRASRPESSYHVGEFEADDAEAALAVIDPDVDNETWVKIGMGLKTAFGEGGFSLWDQWSSRGKKYKEGETQKRWASFTRSGVTLKYLFLLAAERGYKRKLDIAKINKPNDEDFASFWPDEEFAPVPLLREKDKKQPQPQRATVTSIETAREVDLDDVGQLLAAIPEKIKPLNLPGALDPVFKRVANSNGHHDEFVLDAIQEQWPCVKRDHRRNFLKIIKDYRLQQQLQADAASGADEQADDGRDIATEAQFFALFEALDIIHKPMRDLLSHDLTYLNRDFGTRSKVQNILNPIRSKIYQYQERNRDLKFPNARVEAHLEAWEHTFKPRLCIEIPKWDGVERVNELASLVKLKPEFVEEYGITQEFFRQFLRDWIARMWIKLYYPKKLKAQNRLLLLVGSQGLGKDVWLNHLVGGFEQYLCNMTIYANNERDTKAQLHTGVVLNISEFDRTAVMSGSLLKAILTETSTNVRKAYARAEENRLVRCSFVASCNRAPYELFKDWTGNRRFLPFEIDRIRWIKTDDNYRLQVLAEGRQIAKRNDFASSEAEACMRSYLDVLTPSSPEQEVCELFDAIMEMHCSGAHEEEVYLRVREWEKAGNDEYRGFIFISELNELKVIEKIVQQTKYPGRKVGMHLAHCRGHRGTNGKISNKRVGGKTARGYYFGPTRCGIDPSHTLEESRIVPDEIDDETVPF